MTRTLVPYRRRRPGLTWCRTNCDEFVFIGVMMLHNPYLRTIPRQERSVARLTAIFDATSRVLADGGIEALTITSVASEAGIPAASVYDYVADARSLLAAFVTQRFSDTAAATAAVLTPAHDLAGALANVRAVFDRYLTLLREDRGFRIAITASQADDLLTHISFEDSRRNARHLETMLAPFVDPDMTQQLADRCLLAVHLSGATARMLMLIDEADADRMIATYIDVFTANIVRS